MVVNVTSRSIADELPPQTLQLSHLLTALLLEPGKLRAMRPPALAVGVLQGLEEAD